MTEGVVLLLDLNQGIWTRLAPEEKLGDDEVLMGSIRILAVFGESQNDKLNSPVDVAFYVFGSEFLSFLEITPFP